MDIELHINIFSSFYFLLIKKKNKQKTHKSKEPWRELKNNTFQLLKSDIEWRRPQIF